MLPRGVKVTRGEKRVTHALGASFDLLEALAVVFLRDMKAREHAGERDELAAEKHGRRRERRHHEPRRTPQVPRLNLGEERDHFGALTAGTALGVGFGASTPCLIFAIAAATASTKLFPRFVLRIDCS
jgi:hypothetical protein